MAAACVVEACGDAGRGNEGGYRAWVEVGGGTHVIHGRSRATIDSRIPIHNAETGRKGLYSDQADIGCAEHEAP